MIFQHQIEAAEKRIASAEATIRAKGEKVPARPVVCGTLLLAKAKVLQQHAAYLEIIAARSSRPATPAAAAEGARIIAAAFPPAAVPTPPAKPAPALTVLQRYEALTTASERAAFYKAHKYELRYAYDCRNKRTS